MKKTILMLFVLLLSNMAYAEIYHYYELGLNYDHGDVSLDYMNIKPYSYKIEMPVGNFIAEVLSNNNKTLKAAFFNIPLVVDYEVVDEKTGQITSGGTAMLNESKTVLMLPYHQDASEIIIYGSNLNEKLKIDVSQYSKITLPKAEKDLKFAGTKQAVDDKLETLKENKNSILLIAIILISAIVIAYYVIPAGQKPTKP